MIETIEIMDSTHSIQIYKVQARFPLNTSLCQSTNFHNNAIQAKSVIENIIWHHHFGVIFLNILNIKSNNSYQINQEINIINVIGNIFTQSLTDWVQLKNESSVYDNALYWYKTQYNTDKALIKVAINQYLSRFFLLKYELKKFLIIMNRLKLVLIFQVL